MDKEIKQLIEDIIHIFWMHKVSLKRIDGELYVQAKYMDVFLFLYDMAKLHNLDKHICAIDLFDELFKED